MIDQNQFIYQQWRHNSVKNAYMHFMNIYARIQNLAHYVVAGGNAEDSPDYQYLVDEIGIDALVTELGKLIEKEDDKREDNTTNG